MVTVDGHRYRSGPDRATTSLASELLVEMSEKVEGREHSQRSRGCAVVPGAPL